MSEEATALIGIPLSCSAFLHFLFIRANEPQTTGLVFLVSNTELDFENNCFQHVGLGEPDESERHGELSSADSAL